MPMTASSHASAWDLAPRPRLACLRRAILLACVCLTSWMTANSWAQEPVDPWLLHIKIGRLGAMIGNGERALDELSGDGAPATRVHIRRAELDDQAAEDFLTLVDTVRQYNGLQYQACQARLVGEDYCLEPLHPAWLRRPLSPAPTPEELDAWTEEVWADGNSLSGALCDQAMAENGDRQFCALE